MKRCFRMILNIVIPLLGLCLVIFLGPRLLHFFMPFVVGWILALLANPLVRFLERRVKLVRRHGSMLIIIAALAIVIGLFYGAGLLVYREMGSFLADAPEIYQSVRSGMHCRMGASLQNIFRRIYNRRCWHFRIIWMVCLENWYRGRRNRPCRSPDMWRRVFRIFW